MQPSPQQNPHFSPTTPHTEAKFIEALPEWAQALLRTEIAPDVRAIYDSIEIRCGSREGADVFEAVRPALERALPDGYRLVITD